MMIPGGGSGDDSAFYTRIVVLINYLLLIYLYYCTVLLLSLSEYLHNSNVAVIIAVALCYIVGKLNDFFGLKKVSRVIKKCYYPKI